MPICIQKIKVRYECSQEVLNIKEYFWGACLSISFQNKRFYLLLSLMSIITLKNQSQILSQPRNIED